MSKKRKSKYRHRPVQTARNTPEANAPQTEPVEITFEQTAEETWMPEIKAADPMEEQIAEATAEAEPKETATVGADAEALLSVDDEQAITGNGDIAEELKAVPMGEAEPATEEGEMDLEATTAEMDLDTVTVTDAEIGEAEPIEAEPEPVAAEAGEIRLNELPSQESLLEEPEEAEEPEPKPIVTATATASKGGDVLNDQTALFEADLEQETDQAHVPEDQVPVDPEPVEEEKPTNDQPEVDSDVKVKRPSIFAKIPLIGPLVMVIQKNVEKVKEYKRTFYDEKFWKKPRGMHGNMVRSKMLSRGWVYLHRIWWDNSLSSYRDDIIFVKQSDLTKQNPKHLSKWGERALPDPSSGEWIIFNSRIIPPEYEGENGFTASSAYLCMLDTSGEKAIREATVELQKKNGVDRFFIILIGGAFVIIFAFFLMGGFR